METSVQPKSSYKGLWIVVLVFMILGGVAAYLYYYTNVFDKVFGGKVENPPQLVSGGELFQGSVNDNDLYFEFETAGGDYNFSSGELKTLKSGFNYFYSLEDVRLDELIGYIKPTIGNKLLIIYYNPGDKAFDVYTKGPYVGTNHIAEMSDPLSYTIPALHGFIVLSRDNTKIHKNIKGIDDNVMDLMEQKMASLMKANDEEGIEALEDQINDLTGYLASLNGWILMPVDTSVPLTEYLEPFKNHLLLVSVMKSDGTGFEDSTNDFESLEEVEKGMAWIKFGTLNCDDDKYFEYGKCKTCTEGTILNEDGNGCVDDEVADDDDNDDSNDDDNDDSNDDDNDDPADDDAGDNDDDVAIDGACGNVGTVHSYETSIPGTPDVLCEVGTPEPENPSFVFVADDSPCDSSLSGPCVANWKCVVVVAGAIDADCSVFKNGCGSVNLTCETDKECCGDLVCTDSDGVGPLGKKCAEAEAETACAELAGNCGGDINCCDGYYCFSGQCIACIPPGGICIDHPDGCCDGSPCVGIAGTNRCWSDDL